ncbi:DUF3784 domain-containing protein [Anaerobacillus sp. CMMVII]|uniref:DUF3784 domain-containing protein n=1 Tax=Anaerobacillus sp. CMMVII TaxID=2755588 RepID=UPI0021B733D2|nr:DUF3784 domain-containing protein [Anaerobacillus sp. CMMVII]MCT8136760.1 DUF3784 domain-containing protein [Anaerobacillus sp. CMMVII]
MVVLVMVQLLTIAMFLLFGWLILKKEMYGLISGFAMKSEEEQQELINNGYPQASAKGLLNSGYILLIGLLLALFKVPFVIELSWAVMLVYLFGYLLSINKLEAKK